MKAAEAPAAESAGRMYNGGNGGRITLNEAWELLQSSRVVNWPPTTDLRAMETCAIRRRTPRWRCGTWVISRNSLSNRACARR